MPPSPSARSYCPSSDDKSGRTAQIDQIDHVIARIAGRQRGVVGWQQLLAAGVGPGAIAHRIARGRLHRVFRGVYLVGHVIAPELAVETAALLVTPPGTVLSHLSAAGVSQMAPLPRVVDVTVLQGRPASRAGLRVHTARALDPRDVSLTRGLPVTTPARTLVDLAGSLSRDGLERVYEQAQIQRLVRPADVIAVLDRTPGRRGADALRALADELPTLTRSKGERRLLRALAAAGVARPQTNVVVCGHEVDLLWRRPRVVVEFDGFATHHTRAAFERDRRHDAELQAAGHRVIRVTWRWLRDDPDAVAARIAAVIRHGLSSPEG